MCNEIIHFGQGRELNESEYIQTTSGNGSSILSLTNIQTNQTGKYTVEVMNSHSFDVAAVSVAVESIPDRPSGKPVCHLKPKILQCILKQKVKHIIFL